MVYPVTQAAYNNMLSLMKKFSEILSKANLCYICTDHLLMVFKILNIGNYHLMKIIFVQKKRRDTSTWKIQINSGVHSCNTFFSLNIFSNLFLIVYLYLKEHKFI